jgi:tetratricopeptide (TPR) repeat protein
LKHFYLALFAIGLFTSCDNKTKESKPADHLLNPAYKLAYEFRENQVPDSAFYYYNKAKDSFLLQKDSLGAGKCLINMAIIATNQGDYFDGQELSLDAIPYFNEQEPAHYDYIRSNLNNLGIASSELNDYTQAIKFYKDAIKFNTDSSMILVLKNNIGNAYQHQNMFTKALAIYEEVLPQKAHPINYARTLSNYAYTQWLQQPNKDVSNQLLKALTIRINENDIWGQSGSYNYLTNYYLKKQPDSALYYAQKMYEKVKLINAPDDKLLALNHLIKLSKPAAAKNYFEEFQTLTDSLQSARSAAKNQFALIRFETEKHKADNLQLQKENNIRNTYIISLVMVMILGTLIILFWYQKRKEKLALETQNTICESQLKTSKKVHDVVANGLYRLLSQLENAPKIDNHQLLDDIEVLYEQSRDISYEDEQQSSLAHNFDEVVRKLLTSFASENKKVLIIGNNNTLWEKVQEPVKYELLQVLQELMVNMKKHSGASHVSLKFEEEGSQIKVLYLDNGKGLQNGWKKGNGINNTGNRIFDIGGKLTFENGEQGGLKIQINFPLPN